MRRDPRPERLGEVDARAPALDAAPAGQRDGARLRPRRVQGAAQGAAARQPRLGRGQLLQEDERRPRTSPTRRGSTGWARARRTPRSRRSSSGSASRRRAAASRWRTSPAACSRRSRSRGRCSRHRCCCCWTSRRPASTRARSRRCRSSSARSGAQHDSTILLCTHDMNEAEELADRIGLLDRGELLFLEPVEDVKDRLRRRDARGGVLRGDRPHVRGREDRRRRGEGGVRVMAAVDTTFTRRRIVRNELDRPLRGRRAQPVPDQALLPLGPRVPGLDDREHADDRVHLARRRARPGRAERARDASCSSAASSGRSSGSSSRSSRRRSPGSAGRGRSSTRSWRRSRVRST